MKQQASNNTTSTQHKQQQTITTKQNSGEKPVKQKLITFDNKIIQINTKKIIQQNKREKEILEAEPQTI